MRFVILRVLHHNELGMFHEYRRQKKERCKQRAVNFDGKVVDHVFPAAKDSDTVWLKLRYETDRGIALCEQRIKRHHKNWRMDGNCPTDKRYAFVDPGCLFAMVVDSGQRPAIGAWAVFPASDRVTKTILADGESCRLGGASMIALDEGEGVRTLALLRQAKPKLFASDSIETVVPVKQKKGSAVEKTKRGYKLPPSTTRLPQILAAVHAGLKTAVADIVDNAISHDATSIAITFGRPDDGHGRWMSIVDNGCGMDEAGLAEAMRIGSAAKYDEASLGKYGFGLKGASWSQSPAFTVVSCVAGKKPYDLTWDSDDIAEWEAKHGMLPEWAAKAADVGAHGTAVVWTRMRANRAGAAAPRGVDPYTAEVQELHRHLGLIFHRFQEGSVPNRKKVKIAINGIPVIPHNPFGHKLTKAYDRKTVRVPTAEDDVKVYIQAFLLPAEWEVEDLHGTDTEAARADLDSLGLWGRRNESQGIFTYRNNRLISFGRWGDIWTTCDEKTKLARVSVDFNRALDDQFHVDISKEKVSLPRSLQEEIRKIAEMARNESRKKYVRTGRQRPTGKNAPAGGAAPPVGPTPTPGTPVARPTGGARPVATPSAPTIPIRLVKPGKFAWKIVEDLNLRKEIQIGEDQADIRTVADAIKHDAVAMAAFVGFLGRMDRHVVQTKIAGQRTTT